MAYLWDHPWDIFFANFYMAYLEHVIFSDPSTLPITYARYVDDIFIQTDNLKQIKLIKDKFEENSVLKFAIEENMDGKLPFLDIMIGKNNNKFSTIVFHKPTDDGQCQNAKSECVVKYKTSVIFNYINRAYKISQDWKEFCVKT